MDLDFREYYEGLSGAAVGAGIGYLGGSMLGMGYPMAAVGGWLGHKAQQAFSNRQVKADPKYFVYYRDVNGRVVKELLPHEYLKIDSKYEALNNDKNHPYYYYGKCQGQVENGQCDGRVKVARRIKAGYQNWQRNVRYGYGSYGPRQRQGYGQQRYRQY